MSAQDEIVSGVNEREALAKIIERHMLGISPDDQDAVLEDHDWRLVLSALRAQQAEIPEEGAAGLHLAAKPLDWRKPTKRDRDEGGREDALWIAPGCGGEYAIQSDLQNFILWRIDDTFAFDTFPTVEAAKAYAEADWQKKIGQKLAANPYPTPAADGLEPFHARQIAEAMDEGDGFWKPCSGCQEGVDGYVSQKDYPFNPVFRCQPGGGCRECGGLGVLWDDTDYDAMVKAMLADMDAEGSNVTLAAEADGAKERAIFVQGYEDGYADCAAGHDLDAEPNWISHVEALAALKSTAEGQAEP